ncbi:unnamed protein product [Bursaphelenchus xylophilus]|uniref:(pine wood nematode) hypothetical protein n=1 Tax=Bursaphelenchus xylophilus TaxID=6326 RepID=A0A1I7RVF9_BURXY|nr:unnamed protein product [Bursaphelenchus xylophilus]CAG9086778.1 unnamed protein product [Bursaphelenchus xylophilus]
MNVRDLFYPDPKEGETKRCVQIRRRDTIAVVDRTTPPRIRYEVDSGLSPVKRPRLIRVDSSRSPPYVRKLAPASSSGPSTSRKASVDLNRTDPALSTTQFSGFSNIGCRSAESTRGSFTFTRSSFPSTSSTFGYRRLDFATPKRRNQVPPTKKTLASTLKRPAARDIQRTPPTILIADQTRNKSPLIFVDEQFTPPRPRIVDFTPEKHDITVQRTIKRPEVVRDDIQLDLPQDDEEFERFMEEKAKSQGADEDGIGRLVDMFDREDDYQETYTLRVTPRERLRVRKRDIHISSGLLYIENRNRSIIAKPDKELNLSEIPGDVIQMELFNTDNTGQHAHDGKDLIFGEVRIL